MPRRKTTSRRPQGDGERLFGEPLLDELDRRNADIIRSYDDHSSLTAQEKAAALQAVGPMLIRGRLAPRTTRRLLGFLVPVAAHYAQLGLTLDPDTLLSRGTIEDFLTYSGRTRTLEMRRNTVQAAGQLGRALRLREYPPAYPGYAAHPMTMPYTMWDWRFFIAKAEQMTGMNTFETCVLMDLCFGTGARGPQLDQLRGTDVQDWGTHITVTMTVNGTVQHRPVSGEPAYRIAQLAVAAGDAYMLRSDSKAHTRRRAINELREVFTRKFGFAFRIGLAADYWDTCLFEAARARVPFDIIGQKMAGNKTFELIGTEGASTDAERYQLLARMHAEREEF